MTSTFFGYHCLSSGSSFANLVSLALFAAFEWAKANQAFVTECQLLDKNQLLPPRSQLPQHYPIQSWEQSSMAQSQPQKS